MIEEQPTSTDAGTSVATPVTPTVVAQPEAAETIAPHESLVSEAEAEIKHLLQEVHDKIVALAGEHWITSISDELRQARASVEAAGEWIVEHFHRQGPSA